MNIEGMPAWAGKVIFGAAALLLLGLGGWVMTGANAGTPTPKPSATRAAVQAEVPMSATEPTPGTAVPSGSSSAPPAKNPLGNLALPLSSADLSRAATLAVNVTAGMNTYRWDQDPKAWSGKLGALVAGDAASTVTQAIPSGAVLNAYSAQKISSTATATVTKVRLVAEGQAVFVVAVTQVSTGDKGKQATKANYWVSVDTTKSRVTSIQPAGTGNAGATGP